MSTIEIILSAVSTLAIIGIGWIFRTVINLGNKIAKIEEKSDENSKISEKTAKNSEKIAVIVEKLGHGADHFDRLDRAMEEIGKELKEFRLEIAGKISDMTSNYMLVKK